MEYHILEKKQKIASFTEEHSRDICFTFLVAYYDWVGEERKLEKRND